MHFSKTFLGFFAIGNAVAFLSKRDLQTIQTEIGKVEASLADLGTAVQGLTTDPNSAAPLLTASQNADTVIKAATTAIQGTSTLSLTDALSLQSTASNLTSSVTTAINALVQKKPVLDQLGVTSVAVQALQTQKTSSAALGQAIVSKVPAIGQNIAQQSIQQISQVLDNGIAQLQAGAAGGAATPAGGAATPAETPAAATGMAAASAVTTTVELDSSTMTIIPVQANGACMCSVMQ